MFGRQSSPDLKSRMWKFAYRGRSHAETCPVCHGKGKIQKKMRAIPLVVQKRLLAMDVLAEDGLQLGIKGVIKEVQ